MKISASSLHRQEFKATPLWRTTEEYQAQEKMIQAGGGPAGQERQKRLGRLTARERLSHLLDSPESFFELGLWAAFEMYQEWGGLPAAGVITGIGKISGRRCMIIANDATAKAGAMFPQSVKKILRAQRIAFECRLPVIFLVDSSGVFLPLQDEIFPDEDDFGRIFRNNAIFSAAGIIQIAAIMGNCIAGGGYLPVLCDTLLMTKGSGLYLAGPALVKAAIGQVVDTETLGGAQMHAEISGTVDFLENDDFSCLQRIRALVDRLPLDKNQGNQEPVDNQSIPHPLETTRPVEDIYSIVKLSGDKSYDVHDVLACIVDKDSFHEYKASYGKTLVTGYAKIGGISIGIIASQRKHMATGKGEVEIGGVLYAESADKAARFIMTCNQMRIPLVFFQDVLGFMVGKEAEQSGIIRSGAKLVNALSNSIVPKISLLMGSSFGAGHYVLCGKAYDPHFIVAWPGAKYAVMGADQAAETLMTIQQKAAERDGIPLTQEAIHELQEQVKSKYERQTDIRYGAARGWVDAIIPPHCTRKALVEMLTLIERGPLPDRTFHTGVMQV